MLPGLRCHVGEGLQFGTYAAFAAAKGLISPAAASGIEAFWIPCQIGKQFDFPFHLSQWLSFRDPLLFRGRLTVTLV